MTSRQSTPFSNSPSYSCRIWHDRQAIYIELAGGLITKFDKTEGALSKVLKLLERESRPHANGHSKAKLPIPVKRVSRGKVSEVSDRDRARAAEFLKKTGRV